MDSCSYRVEAARQDYYWTVTMSSRLLLGIVNYRAVLLFLVAKSLGISLDGDNLCILLGTNNMDLRPYKAEAASWD